MRRKKEKTRRVLYVGLLFGIFLSIVHYAGVASQDIFGFLVKIASDLVDVIFLFAFGAPHPDTAAHAMHFKIS